MDMGLLPRVWVEKTVHGIKTHWLYDKEKFRGTAVREEDHVHNLLRYDRNYQYKV